MRTAAIRRLAPRRRGTSRGRRDSAGARARRRRARARAALAAPAAASALPSRTRARLAQIEARLAELREAEKLFLRTRDELAGRSEAVAARERLVAQKERELDDREDGMGEWARPGADRDGSAAAPARAAKQPGEQTLGFSGGLRKLEQGTRARNAEDLTARYPVGRSGR